MTTKIQIMSDLHIPHWKRYNKTFLEDLIPRIQTDAEILILAGDIVDEGGTLRYIDYYKECLTKLSANYRHVILTAGNHEMYSGRIATGNELINDLEEEVPNLIVLRSDRIFEYNGQRFLGGTMWQPKDGSPKISDHYYIKDFGYRADKEFYIFKEFLEKNLKENDIVVTHHAPSNKSISPKFIGEPTNRWFITPEIEPLILERKPKLYCHGHTHSGFDYILGNTRVLCNPQGYPGERCDFKEKLVVEV